MVAVGSTISRRLGVDSFGSRRSGVGGLDLTPASLDGARGDLSLSTFLRRSSRLLVTEGVLPGGVIDWRDGQATGPPLTPAGVAARGATPGFDVRLSRDDALLP